MYSSELNTLADLHSSDYQKSLLQTDISIPCKMNMHIPSELQQPAHCMLRERKSWFHQK